MEATLKLHARPTPGYSEQTVLCSCDGERKALTLEVLSSGHVRCPRQACLLTFCERCGVFTSSHQGEENTLVELGSTHTWNCIGCGAPKAV